MSEIKSCPANESHEPVMFFKRDVGGQAHRIECGYCGCQVVMPTREAAIAAWNAGRDPAKLERLLSHTRALLNAIKSQRNGGHDVLIAAVLLEDALAAFEGNTPPEVSE